MALTEGVGAGEPPHAAKANPKLNNPATNQDGDPLEVRVSKDILMAMEDLQALRYVKKDDQGRVRKALFEPDQNQRVKQQIDDILGEISTERWPDE